MSPRRDLWGLMAEYDRAETLLAAARRAHDAGYRTMDAYAPFPVDDLAEALGQKRSLLPWLGFLGGAGGLTLALYFQWWTMAVDLPINVGGRPTDSWTMYLVAGFEMAILGAALALFVGLMAGNKLPMPYHPVFNVEAFARASQDRFFLCIEAADPRFDPDRTARFLTLTGAQEVHHVSP